MIISKAKVNKSVKTIAVQSPERGLGATHICVCLANTLALSGQRVALIEWNGHGDLVEIEKSFHGFGYENSSERMFRIRRVDYYKNYQGKGLAELKKENYDFIIADMGNHTNHYFAEAEYPVLVVSGNEWRARKMLSSLKLAEELVGMRLKVLINFGNQEEISYFQKKSQVGFYVFPFWKDAFTSNKEQRALISRIFL